MELVSCKIPVKLPEFPEGETRELAAKKAGFGSDKTYRDAKTVIEKAIPELIDAMDCGNVAISTAAKLATANVEIQKQAVFNPKEAVRLAKEASSNKVKEIRSIAKEENNKSRELKEQIRESRREENRVIIRNTTSIEQINVKFATILIDPPWDWGDEGDCDQFGRARPDYATLSFDQILALPVNEKADIDCHIYLWITNRSLPKGFSLLDAWGFRYVTCLTWVKPYFGMGNYFRGQTEHILFGIKGSQPLKRNDASTVFHAPRGKDGHSSKPVEFYGFIESCSPGPYLEMFARTKREGWVSWGQNS